MRPLPHLGRRLGRDEPAPREEPQHKRAAHSKPCVTTSPPTAAGSSAEWLACGSLPHGKVAPQERSRETVLSVDRGDRPHYLAIYGGKLTTYCATAECVMQRALPVLRGRGPSRTPATLPFDADAQAVDQPVAKV